MCAAPRPSLDQRRYAARVVGKTEVRGTSEERPAPGSSHATSVNASAGRPAADTTSCRPRRRRGQRPAAVLPDAFVGDLQPAGLDDIHGRKLPAVGPDHRPSAAVAPGAGVTQAVEAASMRRPGKHRSAVVVDRTGGLRDKR